MYIYIYIGGELRTHIVTHIIVQLHLSFILSVDLLHLLDSFQAVMARIAKLVVALLSVVQLFVVINRIDSAEAQANVNA